MVGKKHQCETSWMCGVIKTKSSEISSPPEKPHATIT
jgi:hypothetical protein